jgi:diguanylate cyclase (GGDEF)-like protein
MPNHERGKIRHLLVVQDPQGQRTIPLEVATYSIGRDLQSSIVLHSNSVSRQHAMLLRVMVPETSNHVFRIIDGNFNGQRSTNGIFINGRQSFSHDLCHSDVIHFGDQAQATYHALSNLTDEEFARICTAEDITKALDSSRGEYSTVIVPKPAGSADSREAALVRLASFPELIPNPIIELTVTGQITYLNPAAYSEFPKLQELQTSHPLLEGLFDLAQSHQNKTFLRSLEIAEKVYEQSVHYMAESDLIRVFLTDITERKRAEQELEKRDRLLQAVAAASSCLLTEMDYNTAIKRALGILGRAAEVDRVVIYENHPHEATGEMAMSLRFVWVREQLVETLSLPKIQNQSYGIFGVRRWYDLLSQGKPVKGTLQELPMSEQTLLHRDKIESILMVPIWLDQGCWGHISFQDCHSERLWSPQEESMLFTMAASFSGTFQRRQTEEIMRYRALHDILTDLPNRILFNEKLSAALQQVKHQGDSLAVLFLDLDRFKIINDSLGHSLGDELLKAVAQRLRESLKPDQVVSRWGGDEFTILLPKMPHANNATQEAFRFLKALDPTFHLAGHELYVSASVGIALYDRQSSDAETLIKNADTALYKAKEKGRSVCQVYNLSMNEKTPELLAIEKGLRYALEKDQFVVFYQPQVDLQTRQIIGMEALLRWKDPEMGYVSPGVFIPIAEETGLITPIGEWVIRQACTQNKAWQNIGFPAITISVNLSPKQFWQPRLVEIIAQILADTKLQPQYLGLEVTESIAIENIKSTQAIMQDLNALGIRLSIDDFGIGHSSLSRLQLLPLHTLKIDQSFVKDISRSPKVAHIISAIVTLGQSLNLNLVAEGVEHEEQLAFLQSIHCNAAQGFLFCRPLPAEKMTLVLRRQKHLVQSKPRPWS